MKKILITGASGYLGARICQFLSRKGFHVTGLCYPVMPKDPEWIETLDEIIVGDIRNNEILQRLANQQFDIIIHLISLDHQQSEADPAYVSSINVLPTWSLLDIFSKKGLGQFIYFSTVQVYGNLHDATTIREDYPKLAKNIYGLTHFVGETICEFYNRKTATKVTSVRLSNSFGAPIFETNNCWWLVINDLCKTAYINKFIRLKSDGLPQRDFIHVNDVCQAVELLVSTKDYNIPEGPYNISSGITYSILEVAGKVREIYKDRYGLTIPVSTPAIPEVLDFSIFGNKRKYFIDNSKLKSIGFKLNWDLDKGINELFDYLENNFQV